MKTEMKDSGIDWIGEIPKHWEVTKLKYISSVHGRIGFRGYTKDDLVDEGNGAYTIGGKHITNNVLDLSEPEYISWDKYYESPEIMVKKGDIVFAQRGTLGKSALIRKEIGYATINPSLVLLNNIKINNIFLSWWLLSEPTIVKIDLLNTSTAVPMISQNQIANIDLVLPPKDEQSRIANFLDKKCAEIDELIALQEQMIAQLTTYKQAVITETVTKGLDPNVKMKDSGVEWIGEIPEHWEVKPFKAVYNLGKGLSITKADLVESGIPVISYGQIHSKQNIGTCIKDSLIRFVPEKYLKENKQSLVNRGDVIFADTSEDREGCGNCVYVDKDISLFAGYHTIIARNTSTFKNNYFSFLFQTDCWRIQLRALVNGVKLFSIPQKLLSATSLIVPYQEEQQSIANYLDKKCKEIDELISIKKEKIEQLKAYKKSVIYEYVTGKKQVEIDNSVHTN